MESTTKIQACTSCGGTDFTVEETTVWKASLQDGKLIADKIQYNGADNVTCNDCGAEYAADNFTEVEYA